MMLFTLSLEGSPTDNLMKYFPFPVFNVHVKFSHRVSSDGLSQYFDFGEGGNSTSVI